MSVVYDACVIGAGPAGLAAATQLAEFGWTVALIESGNEHHNQHAQHLADACIETPESHCAMNEGVWRGLGGTSARWGGRCVPFDPVDFEKREYVEHSGWPIAHADLEPFMRPACDFLGAGKARFDVAACPELKKQNRLLSDNFVDGSGICATQLERWSCDAHAWKRNRSGILGNSRIAVFSGLTCVGFSQTALDGPVHHALVKPTSGSDESVEPIGARVFVLACGGVDSTRLVLNSIGDPNGLKLKAAGLVGRFYMGHPSGKIVDIEFEGRPARTLYGFERDEGVYVRRRITFEPQLLRRERLLNIAFWPDNPPLNDPRHRSGILSAAYLALRAPVLGEWLAPAAIRNRVAGNALTGTYEHLGNCARNPLDTIAFCSKFIYQRYLERPRLPGFFTYSSTNRYALHYHAEQVPDWNNHIALTEDCDALGMRRAKISLRWSQQDVDSIVRAHEQLDRRLRSRRIGRLNWRVTGESLAASIRQQAIDGFHQIGTLRMSHSADSGVTDQYGQLYGTANAFAASSAVFPTSGQANPTLTLVAFAHRQAARIDRVLRN